MQAYKVHTFDLKKNIWQGIRFSDSAVEQIIKLMRKQPRGKDLKLEVKKSGCAGFSYVLNIRSDPSDDDLLFERDGAKLYVPLKSMLFIDGTTVDFVREGLNHVFKFNNPNAQHACGCGESFSI